jgi:glycosyltransferase involved in cell wall biosynthesis
MKILFLSRWFPYPIDNGSKLRIYHLLQGLAKYHTVHLLSFSDDPSKAETEKVGEICGFVKAVPWKEFQPNSLKSLMGFFREKPRSLLDTFSDEMEKEIRQVLTQNHYDLVIMSQWQMTTYQHLFENIPTLIEEIEVGVPYGNYKDAVTFYSQLRTGLTWMKQRCYLKKILAENQYCTVVSEKEKSLLKKIAPHSQITVIPNGVLLEEYSGISEERNPNRLIFTGSFRYLPNYEAMLWFVEQVLPLLHEQIPEIEVMVTGDTADLELPKCQGVNQVGFVDNLYSLIGQSSISIVPLLVGGGTRLKILEAMALKTPVVSTSKGAEGLHARADEHLFIADSPQDFAHKVIRLLREPQLSDHFAAKAFDLIQERYDWKVILPNFLKVIDEVVSG